MLRGQLWQAVVQSSLRESATAIARTVGTRLRDPSRVESAVALAGLQTSFPMSIRWAPFRISQGYAGLAVAFGYFDTCFPQEGWEVVAHRCLKAALEPEEGLSHLSAGLFSGLSGLAFAAWYLSKGGTRYGRLLAVLEERLSTTALYLANRLSGQYGMSVHQFDLISGLSGIGAYLLCRREIRAMESALNAILLCLIRLSEEEMGVAGWHTPPALLDKETARSYANGYVNCGLAHGVPGPLALLSLAYMGGMEVAGITDAIQRTASWLMHNRADDQWGLNWPTAIPIEDSFLGSDNRSLRGNNCTESSITASPSRTAWCYGSPGVARSLWIAGQALNEQKYCQAALAAMKAVYDRPLATRNIDSPILCHGVGGLLQITLRFANDTGLAFFVNAANDLCAQLISLFDPNLLLGYRNLESTGCHVDQPGLLDGAAGIPIVLLAAATTLEPSWDRLFLLA